MRFFNQGALHNNGFRVMWFLGLDSWTCRYSLLTELPCHNKATDQCYFLYQPKSSGNEHLAGEPQ